MNRSSRGCLGDDMASPNFPPEPNCYIIINHEYEFLSTLSSQEKEEKKRDVGEILKYMVTLLILQCFTVWTENLTCSLD